MLSWLSQNLVTILVVFALVALVAVIVLVLVRDKRKGKCTCGASCAHCAMAGSCHEKKK